MGRPGCHHGMEQKERMEDFGPRRPCMCALVYSIIITSSAGHSLYFKNSSGGSEPPQEGLLNIFAKPWSVLCMCVGGWLCQDWDNKWIESTLFLEPVEDGFKSLCVQRLL